MNFTSTGVKRFKSDRRQRDIKLLLQNARSIIKSGYLDCVKFELAKHDIGIAIVTETWLGDIHSDINVQIPGYKLARGDRTTGAKGGGVAIYVMNDIHMDGRRTRKYCDESLEYIRVHLKLHDSSLLTIWAVYRPPHANSDAINTLNPLFSNIQEFIDADESDSGIIVAGDINLPLAFQLAEYSDALLNFGLHRHPTSATHRCSSGADSTLDLIYSSLANDPKNYSVSTSIVTNSSIISDHYLIICNFRNPEDVHSTRKVIYKKEKYQLSSFDGVRFDSLYVRPPLCSSANEFLSTFSRCIMDAADQLCERKRIICDPQDRARRLIMPPAFVEACNERAQILKNPCKSSPERSKLRELDRTI